jgi:hypothetical protein
VTKPISVADGLSPSRGKTRSAIAPTSAASFFVRARSRAGASGLSSACTTPTTPATARLPAAAAPPVSSCRRETPLLDRCIMETKLLEDPQLTLRRAATFST